MRASVTQQEARDVPHGGDCYLIEPVLKGVPACSLPISSQKSSSINKIVVHPQVEFSDGYGENIGNVVLYLDFNLVTDFSCGLEQIT